VVVSDCVSSSTFDDTSAFFDKHVVDVVKIMFEDAEVEMALLVSVRFDVDAANDARVVLSRVSEPMFVDI
jgi:hypothetical protein